MKMRSFAYLEQRFFSCFFKLHGCLTSKSNYFMEKIQDLFLIPYPINWVNSWKKWDASTRHLSSLLSVVTSPICVTTMNLRWHHKKNILHFKKLESRGWRGGSQVKNTSSCRHSGFNSQHSFGSLQLIWRSGAVSLRWARTCDVWDWGCN